MAAQYRVYFDDNRSEYVFSADAKSFKKRDIRAAYVKARKKAVAKRAKSLPGGKMTVRVTCVQCVG